MVALKLYIMFTLVCLYVFGKRLIASVDLRCRRMNCVTSGWREQHQPSIKGHSVTNENDSAADVAIGRFASMAVIVCIVFVLIKS